MKINFYIYNLYKNKKDFPLPSSSIFSQNIKNFKFRQQQSSMNSATISLDQSSTIAANTPAITISRNRSDLSDSQTETNSTNDEGPLTDDENSDSI